MKFGEFSIGDTFTTEAVKLTKDEIVEFGKKYDPQYFHTDEEKAISGPFGSLIASGFHSLAAVWSQFIRMDILGPHCLGGLSMDDVRWKLPVKPDDELAGRFTAQEKKLLSDGKRGIITFHFLIINQDEQEVLSGTTKALLEV